MKLSAVFSLLFFAAGSAFAQTTITWKAADNPHVVNGTFTVAAGTTLVLEPGVLVDIKNNSTLKVIGQMVGNGLATNRITFTGTNIATSIVNVQGTSTLSFADIKAQVVPDSNGALFFADCNFSGYGTVFNGTILQLAPSLAPYLQFDRCAFIGDGTYASASLYVAYATVAIRDSSFTGGSYMNVSPGYLFVNNVTSSNSFNTGLDLGSDSDLYLNNLTVTNAAHDGLVLSGNTQSGTNVALGPNITLQGNEYPVLLTIAGLYPGSTIPATGNLNNSIHVTGSAGQGGFWPKFAIPYYVTAAPLTVDRQLRISPGVIVNMAPFTYMNDIAYADGMRAYGTPAEPIIFQRADPAQNWAFLHAERTYGGRLRHVIVDGSSDGVNGGNWRLENCVIRNNGIGSSGGAIVSGTQYLNNSTGHFTAGNLSAPANPNTVQGNGTGVNSTDDARNIYWGSPSGPTTSRNPGGTGDTLLSQFTPFEPFVTSPPSYSDTPPVVKLMRPSFQLNPGSKVTLQWESSDDVGIASHQILFSPSGNLVSSFTTVATLPASQHSYEWTVPAANFSTDSFVKVVAIDTTGKQGFDEWEFIIPTNDIAGSVNFTITPGQTFTSGQMLTTNYTTSGIDPYLTRVEYYLEDLRGETRKLVGRGSSGSGMTFHSTDSARFVISFGDTGSHRKYWYSPLFEIRPDSRLGDAPPTVSLISPAAGASFTPGQVIPITWSASDDESLRSFDILASYDGAVTWQPIAQSLAGTARSFDWQTAPGTGYADLRVMVIAKDLRFQSTSDGASRVFSSNGGGTATDTVTISKASYSSSKGKLTVQASSSGGSSAVLQVFNTSTNELIGTLPSTGRGSFRLSANPLNITVKSSLGGSATAAVKATR